jgi:colanic acid biosynthesis glycosyl transferase WcaI
MKTYVFTNRVYPPVGGATGELLKELAEGLAADGARVVIITSRGPADLKLPKHQMVNGVELIRVGSMPFSRASHLKRALSYGGLYPQLMWQVWKLGKVDAVVSMTDPPLQVAAVTLASCRAKKKIHWAQDVYPELAEELGVISRGGLLAQVLRSISTWALRRQDEVVVVGRCMRERLVRRGVDAGKIEVIPNWSPVGAVSADVVSAMRHKLGWANDFVALYSGNLGLAHDFETLVSAAKLLGGAGVKMVFAGEGPRLEQVRRATQGLEHVSFLPPQAKDDLAAFLAAADVHLVTVRAGLEGLVVPSKAYGILAAERPIFYVGAQDSEVARLLSETNAGKVFTNGDFAGVASALRESAAELPAPAAGCGVFGFAGAFKKWREILE